MSYSYECNVICDGCGNQCIFGAPMDGETEARLSAQKEAERNDWRHYVKGDKWLCPDCAEKDDQTEV